MSFHNWPLCSQIVLQMPFCSSTVHVALCWYINTSLSPQTVIPLEVGIVKLCFLEDKRLPALGKSPPLGCWSRPRVYMQQILMHAFSITLLCPTLCNCRGWSPPDSSVHRLVRARILEWVAISSSKGSSQPRGWIYISHISCIGRQIFLPLRHLGSP